MVKQVVTEERVVEGLKFNDVIRERTDQSQPFHNVSGEGKVSADDTVTMADGNTYSVSEFQALARRSGMIQQDIMGMSYDQLPGVLRNASHYASQIGNLQRANYMQEPRNDQQLEQMRDAREGGASVLKAHGQFQQSIGGVRLALQPSWSVPDHFIGARRYLQKQGFTLVQHPRNPEMLLAISSDNVARIRSELQRQGGDEAVKAFDDMVR